MAGPFLRICFKLIKIFQKGIHPALQNSSLLSSARPFLSQARCRLFLHPDSPFGEAQITAHRSIDAPAASSIRQNGINNKSEQGHGRFF